MPQRKVATLVEDGVEDVELLYPKFRLMEAGAKVVVMTPDGKSREGKHGYDVEAEEAISDVSARDYDALLIPGGVESPDKLRMHEDTVEFVQRFVEETEGPVFSICHGPWLLAEADVLEGVEVTSYASIRRDLENAGARWIDDEVVTDGRFITSRDPDDLPHFGKAIADALTLGAAAAGEGAGERGGGEETRARH